jgi:hypothetical protein
VVGGCSQADDATNNRRPGASWDPPRAGILPTICLPQSQDGHSIDFRPLVLNARDRLAQASSS